MLGWIDRRELEIKEGECRDPSEYEAAEIPDQPIDVLDERVQNPMVAPRTGQVNLDLPPAEVLTRGGFGRVAKNQDGTVRIYNPTLDRFMSVEASLFRDVTFAMSRLEPKGRLWHLRVFLSSLFLRLARFFFPSL
jgi:hypothetical protein